MSEVTAMPQSNTSLLTGTTSDNITFNISPMLANMSLTIKNMVECFEDDGSVIPFTNIKSNTFSKIIEYCENFHTFEQLANDSDEKNVMLNQIKMFLSVLTMEELLHLIQGANFLDIKCLLDHGCQEVADRIRGKSEAEIRSILNVPDMRNSDEPVSSSAAASASK